MKTIELTRGKHVIVDDADYSFLMQFNWYAAKCGEKWWYAAMWTKGKKHLMHRLLLDSCEGEYTDHVNGNGLDNRRDNIRKCTASQNQHNKGALGGTSSFKGVFFDAKCPNKPWRAHIGLNNKRIPLGGYKTEREAATAYNEGAKKYHGEFAWLNILPDPPKGEQGEKL